MCYQYLLHHYLSVNSGWFWWQRNWAKTGFSFKLGRRDGRLRSFTPRRKTDIQDNHKWRLSHYGHNHGHRNCLCLARDEHLFSARYDAFLSCLPIYARNLHLGLHWSSHLLRRSFSRYEFSVDNCVYLGPSDQLDVRSPDHNRDICLFRHFLYNERHIFLLFLARDERFESWASCQRLCFCLRSQPAAFCKSRKTKSDPSGVHSQYNIEN